MSPVAEVTDLKCRKNILAFKCIQFTNYLSCSGRTQHGDGMPLGSAPSLR